MCTCMSSRCRGHEASQGAKWLRLIKDFNGWLALLTLLGTSSSSNQPADLSSLVQAQLELPRWLMGYGRTGISVRQRGPIRDHGGDHPRDLNTYL